MQKEIIEIERNLEYIGIRIGEGRYDKSKTFDLLCYLNSIKNNAERAIENIKRNEWEVRTC